MEILNELIRNPVFAGIMGSSITFGALYFVKMIGPVLWRHIRELVTMQTVIYNSQDHYRKFNVFMSKHSCARRSKTNMVSTWYSWVEEKWKWGLTPGSGWHIFRHKGHWFVILRYVSATPLQNGSFNGGALRDEQYYIYTLGRGQKAITTLLNDIDTIDEDDGSTPIYLWMGGSYGLFQHKEKRPLDTIFIPEAQKKRIVDDIDRFLNNRAFYRRTGKPYRRGYGFRGPPGTGKSSLIFALAGHFDKPVYVINPTSIKTDDELQTALNSVVTGGFLLIEDIDTIDIAKDRNKIVESTEAKEENKSGITLSGLLNGIDGVMTRDGRLLFITSNHFDMLDSALVRPGRIDLIEELDNMRLEEAVSMYKAYFPEGDHKEFSKYIKPLLPDSPASIQNKLIEFESV